MIETVIGTVNEILIDTTISSQSEPESNGNESEFHISQSPKVELYHQFQFIVIPRTPHGFNYCYQGLTIIFNIIQSFALSYMVSSIVNDQVVLFDLRK